MSFGGYGGYGGVPCRGCSRLEANLRGLWGCPPFDVCADASGADSLRSPMCVKRAGGVLGIFASQRELSIALASGKYRRARSTFGQVDGLDKGADHSI